jgi:hypothetical protein
MATTLDQALCNQHRTVKMIGFKGNWKMNFLQRRRMIQIIITYRNSSVQQGGNEMVKWIPV